MSQDTGKMRLALAASAVGTLLEWYDLYLAIILAKVLSNQLFPGGESVYFLETLAIVGSSFFVRPLGSLFFGSLGDRKGRKRSFLLSLLLMGGATFLIGLLPTFEQIGWWAPFFLLALRLIQGFALSGEYSGAIIYVAENAPEDKKGY
jgi:MFS family permease